MYNITDLSSLNVAQSPSMWTNLHLQPRQKHLFRKTREAGSKHLHFNNRKTEFHFLIEVSISSESFQKLISFAPQVKVIEIYIDTEKLTADSWLALSGLKNLKRLRLPGFSTPNQPILCKVLFLFSEKCSQVCFSFFFAQFASVVFFFIH